MCLHRHWIVANRQPDGGQNPPLVPVCTIHSRRQYHHGSLFASTCRAQEFCKWLFGLSRAVARGGDSPVIATASVGFTLLSPAGLVWYFKHNRSVTARPPKCGKPLSALNGRNQVSCAGNIRNLGLSTTSGRFFSRSSGVHPMKLSRGASFQAAVEKPSMASRFGHGRRSASGPRPGSCIRGSGRRTRSRACLPACCARRRASGGGEPPRGSSEPGRAAPWCRVRRRWASAVPAATWAAAAR